MDFASDSYETIYGSFLFSGEMMWLPLVQIQSFTMALTPVDWERELLPRGPILTWSMVPWACQPLTNYWSPPSRNAKQTQTTNQ